MRLERLHLTGFGRFRRVDLELSPGLNVIFGRNEAGKSTIGHFVLGMLYGFKKRSQRREFTEDLERYRPWSGGEYRGALVYRLESSGLAYRVERHFDARRDEVRVFDAITGADLTSTFPMDRRKEMLFAQEHLGLTEEAYRSTAWIGQMEISRIQAGPELMSRIANVQESGREDLSIQAVLGVLEEQIRSIGSERAPARPYGRVLRQLDQKRQELERARRTRAQVMEWEVRLAEVRQAKAVWEAEGDDLRRLRDWARLQEVEGQLTRVDLAESRLAKAEEALAVHQSFAGFTPDWQHQLVRLQAECESAREHFGRVQARYQHTQAALADAEVAAAARQTMAEHGPSVAEALALSKSWERDYQTRAVVLEGEVKRLHDAMTQVDEAIQPLRITVDQGTALLPSLERVESEMNALSQGTGDAADSLVLTVRSLERAYMSLGGGAWLAAAIGLVATSAGLVAIRWSDRSGSDPGFFGVGDGAVLGFAGFLVLAGLGCAWVFAGVRQKRRRLFDDAQSARERLAHATSAAQMREQRLRVLQQNREEILGTGGVSSRSDVQQRLVLYEQLMARRGGYQLQLETVSAQLRDLRAEGVQQSAEFTRKMVAAMGDAAGDADADRFHQAWNEYQALSKRWEALGREAQELTAQCRIEEIRLAEGERALQRLYDEAGVDGGERLGEMAAGYAAWERARADVDVQRKTLDALQASQPRSAMEAEVATVRNRVSGVPQPDLKPTSWYDERIREAAAGMAEIGALASDLPARIETALQDELDPADIERDLTALEEERARLAEELAALDLARETLVQVSEEMHREFAPRLNQAMAGIVHTLTKGTYEHVTVDEDLTIRTRADGERTVLLSQLSGGTVDQFYLAMRLALVDLVSGADEPAPIVLDDPFVQFDDDRSRAAMTVLAEAAKYRQILLLTCHGREASLAQSVCPGAQVIDLTGMEAQDPT